jgi:hypothetical protein
MKLLFLSSLIVAPLILAGCDNSVQNQNEQFQTFIFQNKATNQYVYTSNKGYRDLVEVANIKPQSKNYELIQQRIEYSIQTNRPVCFRYQSASAIDIIDLCEEKSDVIPIVKNNGV